MHEPKSRDPVIERFLALSARYLFHAFTDIDERGRVVIEWPERLPLQRPRQPMRAAVRGVPRSASL
ncbi:MAG TPA: hypothetical protein VGE16_12945 [Albitalea sp.]